VRSAINSSILSAIIGGFVSDAPAVTRRRALAATPWAPIPRNLRWKRLGVVNGLTKSGAEVTYLRYTPVDVGRYPGAKVRELAKRLPRRLRAA
jgi:hypothetical protein